MDIRDYEPRDRQAVVALHVEAMVHAGVYRGPNLHEQDLLDIEGVYVDSPGAFLVGELDGAIVAMGAFKKGLDGLAELKRMRVKPVHQGKGFGGRMFDALEQRAREMGYRGFCLDTSVLQVSAQKLYLSRGCIETGRVHHDGFDCIEYEKLFK